GRWSAGGGGPAGAGGCRSADLPRQGVVVLGEGGQQGVGGLLVADAAAPLLAGQGEEPLVQAARVEVRGLAARFAEREHAFAVAPAMRLDPVAAGGRSVQRVDGTAVRAGVAPEGGAGRSGQDRD